jgi:BTB/POZ domain
MSTENAERVTFVPCAKRRLTRFCRIFSGKVFRFDVGEDPKSFTLHSRLVSKSSPVFRAMMDGQMKEAIESRVRLEHIDHDTFTRFAEYLYGNDYNPAEALVVLEQSKDSEASGAKSPIEPTVEPMTDSTITNNEQQVAADDDWDLSLWTASKKHKKTFARVAPKRSPRLEELKEVALPGLQIESFPKLHNKSARNDVGLKYDYTEILSHIQLYTFAGQYQIENLQRLVLSKLRGALDQTKFHPQKMHEFLDILIMAYENTRDSDEKEPLRNLLTLFGAWHFPDLVASENYLHLIDDYKDCIAHLSQKVARRL